MSNTTALSLLSSIALASFLAMQACPARAQAAAPSATAPGSGEPASKDGFPRHRKHRRSARDDGASSARAVREPVSDQAVGQSFAKLLDPTAPLSHPASDKALEMLGAQYKWGGSTEESGMDCSGFVFRSYKDATGLVLPRSADQMAEKLDKVLPHEMRAGDLVFFNTLGRPHSHVGIYLGGSLFAHSPRTGQKARIDNIADPYWLSAFDGARRPSSRPSKEALSHALDRWDPAAEPAQTAAAAELPPLPPSMAPALADAAPRRQESAKPAPPAQASVAETAPERARPAHRFAEAKPKAAPAEAVAVQASYAIGAAPLDVSGMSVALPERSSK